MLSLSSIMINEVIVTVNYITLRFAFEKKSRIKHNLFETDIPYLEIKNTINLLCLKAHPKKKFHINMF